MSYFTYSFFRDVSLDQLKAKVEANLALYELSSEGAQVKVYGFQGDGCAVLLMGTQLREEMILRPVGFQLGCIWMDVRYQSGASWELTIMKGTEHLVSHYVNPWAYEERVEYNQERIDYRINRVCELWPRQGDVLRPYLLPWRVPVTKFGRTRFIRREGKAYETNRFNYGDAHQIYDFIHHFGIDEQSPHIEIGRNT